MRPEGGSVRPAWNGSLLVLLVLVARIESRSSRPAALPQVNAIGLNLDQSVGSRAGVGLARQDCSDVTTLAQNSVAHDGVTPEAEPHAADAPEGYCGQGSFVDTDGRVALVRLT